MINIQCSIFNAQRPTPATKTPRLEVSKGWKNGGKKFQTLEKL